MKITYEDVVTAIDQMMQRGQNPTIAGVRAELGDRGSNTTISKHINAWRESRRPKADAPTATLAGIAPPDSLQAMSQSVWEKAREEAELAAESRLKEYREEIDQELELARAAEQDAKDQMQLAFAKMSAVESINKDLINKANEQAQLFSAETQELKAHIAGLKLQLEAEKSLVTDLESKLKESQSAHQETTNDLNEQICVLRAQMDEQSKGHTSTLKDLAERHSKAMSSALSASENQESRLYKEIDQLRQAASEKDRVIRSQAEEFSRLTELLEDGNKHDAMIASKLIKLSENNSAVQTGLNTLVKSVSELQAMINSAVNEDRDHKLGLIQSDLSKLLGAIANLNQDQ